MPTLDNHASLIEENIWGDFTSIRIKGKDLIFIDQSTNRVVGKVALAYVELIENGNIWEGDR